MSEERLDALLLAWQEHHLHGRDVPAAELCRDCPELADELGKRIAVLRRMDLLAGASPCAVTEKGPPPSTDTLASQCPPFVGESVPATAVTVPGYEVLRELGRGGMGVVYLARQVHLDRLVALKMILYGSHAGAEERLRFLAEARAIASLKHPGIVQVHDYGTHQGLVYFVLEYCPGGSLADHLDGTPLPAAEAARFVAQVAQAMHTAHQAGIVHRDLKPANVLLASSFSRGSENRAAEARFSEPRLNEDALPRITDFGLAKFVGEAGQTRTGAVMGTPSYMAPEQAQASKEVGPLADVYALGAILYECLTGRPPFKAATTLETLAQVTGEEPVPPRRLNPGVPRDLQTIALKCLDKVPSQRYASAQALADDIDRFLRGEAIRARPIGAAERGWRWCRRNPALASLSAAFGLLLLAAAVAGPTVAVRQASLRQEADEQRHLAEERAEDLDVERRRAQANAAEASAQARAARHALYAARQQVALNAWRENRADRLAEVLQRQKPAPGEEDLRGFEWSYLDRLARSPGQRWQSSGPMVNTVAISPDDRTAVTAGFDGKATAWDVATGRRKWDSGATLRWSVNAAAFAPDDKTIALAGHLGQLWLWGRDGTARAQLSGHRMQVFGVAFSPDGRTLASAGADRTVLLWDVATGNQVGVLGKVADARAAPGGLSVVAQTDPTQSVGHTNMVWKVAWAPDGKRLASCSSDGSVKVWAVPERKLLRTLAGHEGIVVAVAWSPDGRQIASVSRPPVGPGGGQIKLWNPDTGRADVTFRPAAGGLHAVAFTPDGLYLVTAGQDRTVRVWRKDGRAVAEHRGFRDEVIGLGVGGGGRWAVAGTRGGEIVALDLDATLAKHSLAASAGTRLAVARDGRLAVFRDGAVSWYDPETLAQTAVWPAAALPRPKQGANLYSSASAFALRPDGQAAHGLHRVIGSGTVVWRDEAGKVRHLLEGHAGPITAVAFLPGDRLASADEEGTVKIWNGAGGKAQTVQVWAGPVRFLASTGDGRLWAGGAPWAPGNDKQRTQRKMTRQGRLARIEHDAVAWHTTTAAVPQAADLSPDGRTIVVGHDVGELVWLDARTGKEVRRLSPATNAAVSLRFSPDGRRLAVAGGDGAARLLDATSGEELLVLEGPVAAAADLAFFAGGRRLAVCITARVTGTTLVVWDGRPASDPPNLPSPDATWHKARLAVATGQADGPFGPAVKDRFAMRRHLERLAVLEPDQRQWPLSLLALDQEAGDFRAAAARLEKVLRRWPNDASLWYNLGNTRRRVDDDAGAEAAFRKCLSLDDALPEAHCNLGLLLARQGRFEEAVKSLARGHELGLARQKAGKRWGYPSAAWLAHYRRLGDLAARYAARKEFADVPEADRAALVEALTLVGRPLAAAQVASAKAESSPGPVVIGAALRCAEGIGDAAGLTAAERSAWRARALAWLRLDLEHFRRSDPSRWRGQCAAMLSHPLLRIAQGDRTATWPATERDAWQRFWAEVKAGAAGK
jgi:WD40 repeat protein/tetratricopeptide (TPR) repeat protein